MRSSRMRVVLELYLEATSVGLYDRLLGTFEYWRNETSRATIKRKTYLKVVFNSFLKIFF
jgi:hypothetical protein